VLITIGPADADVVRRWTEHLLGSLEVLRARRDLLPYRLPDEAIDGFQVLLTAWREHAEGLDEFLWTADLDLEHVRMLVQYWANLDSMDEELLARLGLTWSPEGTRPFFEAVAVGVAAAFEQEGDDSPFARHLVERGRDRKVAGGPEGSPG